MTLKALILEQLKREQEPTRRALEQVPAGKYDWKPHPKSMALGQLAQMVATMPSWIAMMIQMDELDIRPTGQSGEHAMPKLETPESLLQALEKADADAREAVSKTTDEFLQTGWKLLEGGKVVSQNPRYVFILDNFTHLAHHRGQLSVYLRLNDAKVPAIYGPSADDHRF